MGRKHTDIVNQKFGLLTTLEKIIKNNVIFYLCKCECGKYKEVRAYELISGKTKSCGCLRSVKRRKPMIGYQFGKWIVLSYSHYEKIGRKHFYLCECQCDDKIIKIVDGASLRFGTSKSCGCLQKEIISQTMFKHGDYKNPLYLCWQSIKRRCNNPSETAYHNYGGRGISYCLEWEEYINFKKDMIDEYIKCINTFPDEKPTIERIDFNQNYCKDNCTFIPLRMQASNTRKNKYFKAISPDGIEYLSKNQNEFARQHNFLCSSGINNCLKGRISHHKNWTFEYTTNGEFV